MKIICAGLPKTGTKSIAVALRMLGFVVHDSPQQFQYHIKDYAQAFKFTSNIPDFASMYSKVDAVTDAPACLFWKELKETFPYAKVILMERDSTEVWTKSLIKTFMIIRNRAVKPWNRVALCLSPSGRHWNTIGKAYIEKGIAGHNAECLSQAYIQHNSRVKSSIPRDDLLVYNVKQGWKPLCDFLGVDVPDVPFPRLNVKSDMVDEIMNDVIFDKVYSEMVLLTVVLIIVSAVLIFFMKSYIL